MSSSKQSAVKGEDDQQPAIEIMVNKERDIAPSVRCCLHFRLTSFSSLHSIPSNTPGWPLSQFPLSQFNDLASPLPLPGVFLLFFFF